MIQKIGIAKRKRMNLTIANKRVDNANGIWGVDSQSMWRVLCLKTVSGIYWAKQILDMFIGKQIPCLILLLHLCLANESNHTQVVSRTFDIIPTSLGMYNLPVKLEWVSELIKDHNVPDISGHVALWEDESTMPW